MKNHLKTILLATIILSTLSLSFTYRHNYFKTTVVISETKSIYVMAAFYDDDKIGRVIQYIDECLKPSLIFKNREQLDEKIILKDKTTFYFQFSPGNMKIKLLKSENSSASLRKIKKMCSGLNSVLNR